MVLPYVIMLWAALFDITSYHIEMWIIDVFVCVVGILLDNLFKIIAWVKREIHFVFWSRFPSCDPHAGKMYDHNSYCDILWWEYYYCLKLDNSSEWSKSMDIHGSISWAGIGSLDHSIRLTATSFAYKFTERCLWEIHIADRAWFGVRCNPMQHACKPDEYENTDSAVSKTQGGEPQFLCCRPISTCVVFHISPLNMCIF